MTSKSRKSGARKSTGGKAANPVNLTQNMDDIPCKMCNSPDPDGSLLCEACNSVWHWRCAKLAAEPGEEDPFFCPDCKLSGGGVLVYAWKRDGTEQERVFGEYRYQKEHAARPLRLPGKHWMEGREWVRRSTGDPNFDGDFRDVCFYPNRALSIDYVRTPVSIKLGIDSAKRELPWPEWTDSLGVSDAGPADTTAAQNQKSGVDEKAPAKPGTPVRQSAAESAAVRKPRVSGERGPSRSKRRVAASESHSSPRPKPAAKPPFPSGASDEDKLVEEREEGATLRDIMQRRRRGNDMEEGEEGNEEGYENDEDALSGLHSPARTAAEGMVLLGKAVKEVGDRLEEKAAEANAGPEEKAAVSNALRVLEAEFMSKVGSAEGRLAATLAEGDQVTQETAVLQEDLTRAEEVFEWALLDLETAQYRAARAAERKRTIDREMKMDVLLAIREEQPLSQNAILEKTVAALRAVKKVKLEASDMAKKLRGFLGVQPDDI